MKREQPLGVRFDRERAGQLKALAKVSKLDVVDIVRLCVEFAFPIISVRLDPTNKPKA